MNLNTFSIVGRCSRSGQLGVAVSTKVPGVGGLCPFVRAGIGAVATQAWVNPYLGFRVLDALATGLDAVSALESVLAKEVDREIRQVGVVDARGGSAAFTGRETDGWRGDRTGPSFAVQGNMLVSEDTLTRMIDAFHTRPEEPLAERLMRALEAGQLAGGDRRGRQSASILVRGSEDYPLVAALPTKQNPHGDFAEIRKAIAPKG